MGVPTTSSGSTMYNSTTSAAKLRSASRISAENSMSRRSTCRHGVRLASAITGVAASWSTTV